MYSLSLFVIFRFCGSKY